MMVFMKPTITGNDIQDMVTHHLGTPPNGYLGSPYGTQIKEMLQNPEATGVANAFIAKLRQDVPVLTAMPNGAVNIYYQDTPPDRRELILDVAGNQVVLG